MMSKFNLDEAVNKVAKYQKDTIRRNEMKKGKWKITKFWGEIGFDEKGYKYEVGYHTEDDVEDTEYFNDKEEAVEYLEEKEKE